jgi:hypothetical protein
MTEVAPDTMSQDVFDQNWSTIAVEVNTILAAKGKTRKRFRIVAVYEKSSGELLAEVLRTSFGPVVVYRAGAMGHGSIRRDPGAELPSYIIGTRQGRGALKFDVQPFTGYANQYFMMTTRCPVPGLEGAKFHHVAISAQDIVTRNSVGGLFVFR